MTPFEIIEVHTLEVACDGLPAPKRSSGSAQAGGGGALGHPRVYLHIDRDHGDKVVCGYCSRTYIYKESHASSAA